MFCKSFVFLQATDGWSNPPFIGNGLLCCGVVSMMRRLSVYMEIAS